jgi:hypothetical protein
MVMGFLIGPAPIAAEPDDAELTEAERGRPRTSGHAIGGIDFYVWDEDPGVAEEWALALARAPGEPTRLVRWRTVAERTAALPSVLVNEHDVALATRIADACGGSALTPLGLVLCLLPSLDRTHLISSFATSSDPEADIAREARSAAGARAARLV